MWLNIKTSPKIAFIHTTMESIQEKQFVYKKYTPTGFLFHSFHYYYDLLIVSAFWGLLFMIFSHGIPFLAGIAVIFNRIIIGFPMLILFLLIFDIPNKFGLLGIDGEGNIYLNQKGIFSRFKRDQFTGFQIAKKQYLNNVGFIVLKNQNRTFVVLPILFYGSKNLEEIGQNIHRLCHLDEFPDVIDTNFHYKQDALKIEIRFQWLKKSNPFSEMFKNTYLVKPGVELMYFVPEKPYKFPSGVLGIFITLFSILLFTICIAIFS